MLLTNVHLRYFIGMHICAEIIKFDPENGYTLRFLHGPYAAGEDPDFKDRLGVKKPAGATSKPKYFIDRVKPEWISVDMSDQYGTELPLFIVGATTVQLIYFFASTREQGPYGPPVWWMKVIGTFPRCDDLRGQTWRLFSYQLVHSDSGHMLFNALM